MAETITRSECEAVRAMIHEEVKQMREQVAGDNKEVQKFMQCTLVTIQKLTSEMEASNKLMSMRIESIEDSEDGQDVQLDAIALEQQKDRLTIQAIKSSAITLKKAVAAVITTATLMGIVFSIVNWGREKLREEINSVHPPNTSQAAPPNKTKPN